MGLLLIEMETTGKAAIVLRRDREGGGGGGVGRDMGEKRDEI